MSLLLYHLPNTASMSMSYPYVNLSALFSINVSIIIILSIHLIPISSPHLLILPPTNDDALYDIYATLISMPPPISLKVMSQ